MSEEDRIDRVLNKRFERVMGCSFDEWAKQQEDRKLVRPWYVDGITYSYVSPEFKKLVCDGDE